MPRYVRFECPDGNSSFSIHYVENFEPGETIVYFESENLDEEVDVLRKQGVEFEQMPIDQSWLWREAKLTDPDGNRIILYHAGENRLSPPWKVKD